MFGQHDDVSDQNTITALPPDGVTVAPVIDDEPALPAEHVPSVVPDFITTDQHGQPDPTSSPSLPTNTEDLLNIKQDALKQLSPLVDHLNQTPEEKFRTTMMMIQASDDQSLISNAYTAAKEITDEKTRAQALLDIINEINYFTQHHEA
jgi:hypothetical protein